MTKFKEYYLKMIDSNKELFAKFTKLHRDYSIDNESHQEEFNKEGEKVLKIIHEWENRLCAHSEKAGYANYTGNLAEKFQIEIKSHFPLIDHIGIIVKKFNLKKISL